MIQNRFIFLLVFLAVFFFPLTGQGGEVSVKPLGQDGFLSLYHSHSHEFLEAAYERNGVIDPTALRRINHFMRSRDSGKEIEIDLNLIRFIDHLQDHFGADTVEVICGYRTPDFNRLLKKEGKNVAESSNHMKGIAVDIHLDEISEKKIQAYARRLKIGGVGYYPDSLMVHVDLGRVHFWQSGNFSDRTDIGIFNEKLHLRLKTDHLFYFPGDRQKVTLSNPENLSLKPNLILEHFFRGEWREDDAPSPLPPMPCRHGVVPLEGGGMKGEGDPKRERGRS